MGFPITISASFLLSTSSLRQALQTLEVLITSTSSPETQLLTLDPTSIMSRDLKDPKADYYGNKYLPDPQLLTSRTVPTDSYQGDRYLSEHQMPTGRILPSDPAGYISSTANIDGWRGQRPFEVSLPYEGEDQSQYLDSLTLAPIQGVRRQTTSMGDRNTGRSVQNTRNSRRPEERASERHAPTAHESQKTRRSEERSSGNPGEAAKNSARNRVSRDLFAETKAFHKGISRTYAFHASTSNTTEKQPAKFQRYCEQEQEDIIKYLKARKSWAEIDQMMGRCQNSAKAHWHKVLKKDPRARGVKYNPSEYDL